MVAGFCYLLPDLVDKPLWLLGIGYGRYIAHTLLFLVLVTVAFSLVKRAYSLFALLGGAVHLFVDLSFVPWLYPFVDYDFPRKKFSEVFTIYSVSKELICAALVALAVLSVLLLASWIRGVWQARRADRRSVRPD